MKKISKKFGTHLRNVRKGRITSEALAKEVGINRTYISQMENNGWIPDIDVAMKLSTSLCDTKLFDIFLEEKMPKLLNVKEFVSLKQELKKSISALKPIRDERLSLEKEIAALKKEQAALKKK